MDLFQNITILILSLQGFAEFTQAPDQIGMHVDLFHSILDSMCSDFYSHSAHTIQVNHTLIPSPNQWWCHPLPQLKLLH